MKRAGTLEAPGSTLCLRFRQDFPSFLVALKIDELDYQNYCEKSKYCELEVGVYAQWDERKSFLHLARIPCGYSDCLFQNSQVKLAIRKAISKWMCMSSMSYWQSSQLQKSSLVMYKFVFAFLMSYTISRLHAS